MQPSSTVPPSPEELLQPQPNNQPNPNQAMEGSVNGEQQQAQSIEQGTAAAQQPVGQQSTQQLQDQTVAFALPGQPTLPAVPGTASQHSPAIADDNDLIEKEWVNKAKHIVEQTKEDPYTQTREINKMKADYLQKRYAKDLKLPEE